jgi:hypothetical protein
MIGLNPRVSQRKLLIGFSTKFGMEGWIYPAAEEKSWGYLKKKYLSRIKPVY